MQVLLRSGIGGTLGSWARSGDDDDRDRTGEMGSNKGFDVGGVSGAAVCSLLTIGIFSCSPSNGAADTK